MSDNRNRGMRDFSKYDTMATEDLEEILRLDTEAPVEQESDTEFLLYIMGVLANRRSKDNPGKTAQEAWESFQQNYLPCEEEIPDPIAEDKKHSNASHPWLRRLAAAAAAVVLVVCIPLTANAFGWEDIWNVVAKWAKETFSFVSGADTQTSPPSPGYDGVYTSLQDVLRANSRNADIVPTWIPDGYTLEKVEKDITPMKELYAAFYRNGDRFLRIRVQSYLDTDPENIEVNDELLEIYEVSGVQYYIFFNMNQIRALWINDSYECNISGDLSIEEIKSMIDSIGKG